MSLETAASTIRVNNIKKILKVNNKKKILQVNNKNRPKPIFIIKYGPPASGKGSKQTLDVIRSIAPLESFVNINIDDVIESMPYFKNKSREIVQTYLSKKKLLGAKNINFKNHNFKRNVLISISKLYMGLRKTGNPTINNKLDTVLTSSLQQRRNIIIETTGGYGFPLWIFNNLGKLLEPYTVYLVFPLVQFKLLLNRYRKRPVNSYIRGGPFRMTSNAKNLKNQYITSYKEFIKYTNFLKNKGVQIRTVNQNSLKKNLKGGTNTNLVNKYLKSKNEYVL